MNIRTVIFLALAAALATAGPAAAGTIEGTVTVSGAKDNANAVVWIEGAESGPPAEKAVLDQEGMVFIPHVLPVQVGTTVEFKNSDTVNHNVFTPDPCADSFNLGTWAKGESRTHTFDKPCKAVMLCAIHPEMEAWVVAVPSSHFAVTGPDGRFAIEGVPAGSHTVKLWHPKGAEASTEVSVDGSATVDLTLGD